MKEDRDYKASEMLAAILPELGRLARQLALMETDYNIDLAFELLDEFNETYADSSKVFASKRKRYIKTIKQQHLDRLLTASV
jgi:hypothetical protein